MMNCHRCGGRPQHTKQGQHEKVECHDCNQNAVSILIWNYNQTIRRAHMRMDMVNSYIRGGIVRPSDIPDGTEIILTALFGKATL